MHANRLLLFVSVSIVATLAGCASPPLSSPAAPPLSARIVAVGIPGASAVTQIGVFHKGGPLRDKPAFAAMTAPGRVMDAERLFVTSNHNFGAPRTINGWPAGAVLSLDPTR